jgi:hypothetical protein
MNKAQKFNNYIYLFILFIILQSILVQPLDIELVNNIV